MIRHKHFDKIVIVTTVLALIFATGLLFKGQWGLQSTDSMPPYANKLFDDSYVHQIDLQFNDPESFFANAKEEKYVEATITIDGEVFENVGLRVKGNNSLRLVERYGLTRYSMKIEFDHYNKDLNYYGLDKMSLDCSFQDNSYLKNYMTYQMMSFMEVPSSLCSYTWVTINDKDWGLFLVIEEVEEAFVKRNFGKNYGKLYKPGYRSLDDENADIALKYIGDDVENYNNIFNNARFDITLEDKKRLIEAIKILDSGKNLETAVNIDEVLAYFVVQVFVVNMDSYLGRTGHNYFLYEEDGIMTMIPWDYNLAFATYSLGMPNPINDATLYVNYPINTPASGTIMKNRPLYHHVMKNDDYYKKYHEYFDYFVKEYYENGYFEKKIAKTTKMIAPYVKKDPTAFCSYEDYLLGVETFKEFCSLRFQSVRGQLEGKIASTWKEQETNTTKINADHIWLPDMGEIADLKD